MVFLIDISNLDSHLFEMLSQTSDNLYIYMADLERDFSRWSKSSVDYFNLPGEYIADTANEWVKHIHPQDQHIFLEDIGRIFAGKSNRHNCEYRALNKYGKYVWVKCQGVVERHEDGSLGLFVGTMMNLGVNAKFDQPTGLYTFHELKKQLPVFINQGMEGAILLFDVDRLQRINDLLGYMVGDEVLQLLGQKCHELVGVTFYRGQGGKFYCITTDLDRDKIEWIYQQVKRFGEEVPRGDEAGDPADYFLRSGIFPPGCRGLRDFACQCGICPGTGEEGRQRLHCPVFRQNAQENCGAVPASGGVKGGNCQ